MTDKDRQHWQDRYIRGNAPAAPNPNHWIVEQAAHVDAVASRTGNRPQALDLACGAGGTLLWLAGRGWQVTGVDISMQALSLARAYLDAAGLSASANLIPADLDTWQPQPASCDLVTCFYFLDRSLWPGMAAALRSHGLICLSTYHTGRLLDRPDTNPGHLLARGELVQLIAEWGWTLLASRTSPRTESILAQRP